MPIASWDNPTPTTPGTTKAPSVVAPKISDWTQTPQAKNQAKAAAAVAADPNQHLLNPLNPNYSQNDTASQKLYKPSLFGQIASIADNIATGVTTVAGHLGLQPLMDIPAAARDYVAHPEGPDIGAKDVFNATKTVGKQIGQQSIALPADVTIGTYEEATNQQLGPVQTPLGTFQSPQETKRQLQAAGYGPFVSSLGAVGNETLNASNFVAMAVALDDVISSTSNAAGTRIATEKLSGELTPAELQAKLDAGEIKTAPGRELAQKLIDQNKGLKVDLSKPASEIRRYVGENLLGGEAQTGGSVETPNGFPKSTAEAQQLTGTTPPTEGTVGFPKAISEASNLAPAIVPRTMPAAVTGFPTSAPSGVLPSVTTPPITSIQAPAGPIDNTVTPNPADAAKQAELQSGFVAGPSQMLDDVRSVIDNFKAGMAKEADAQRLRIKLVGEGNVRIAQANQLIDSLKQIVKDPVQQEVLDLFRNFKDRPQELQQYLDGNHPQFQEAVDYFKSSNPDATPSDLAAFRAEQLKVVNSLSHVIKAAMNPSESIKAVDVALTEYSKTVLSEGHQLGILESSINPETYVPQFTEPTKTGPFSSKATGGKYGGKFVHGISRTFFDPLHALVNLHEPQSLNAFNNFTVYAERYGHAAAVAQFLRNLQAEGLTNFDPKSTPENWVARRIGKKLVYLPKNIDDAIGVILDSSQTIPGWLNNTLAYQTFIKSTEVSLSIFHAKALTLTAMADVGPVKAFQNFMVDQESQAFKDMELDGIKHGLTTSIEGRSIEAKKIINQTSLPSRTQAIASLPAVKQVIQASDALTRATFDVVQRNEKVKSYSMKVSGWMANHPNLTEQELFNAKTDIARMVNATYGGLNWEALGVSKVTRLLARAFTFAPDWWWSNILSARYAFEGGVTGNWQDYFSNSPAGKYSRAFWLKAVIGGLVATQLASLAISHKMKPKRPFSVYLGKDKDGKELYANWFFVGGPGDFAKWVQNVADQGVIGGTVNTLANKMGSIPRGLMHQATNKNFMGQDIAIKGAPNTYNDLRRLWAWIADTAPIPFTGTDVANLAIDPKKEATFWDYFNIMAGSTTSHKIPDGEYQVPSGNDKGKVKPIPQKTLNRPKKSLWDFLKTGGSIYKPVK